MDPLHGSHEKGDREREGESRFSAAEVQRERTLAEIRTAYPSGTRSIDQQAMNQLTCSASALLTHSLIPLSFRVDFSNMFVSISLQSTLQIGAAGQFCFPSRVPVANWAAAVSSHSL